MDFNQTILIQVYTPLRCSTARRQELASALSQGLGRTTKQGAGTGKGCVRILTAVIATAVPCHLDLESTHNSTFEYPIPTRVPKCKSVFFEYLFLPIVEKPFLDRPWHILARNLEYLCSCLLERTFRRFSCII